MFLTRFIKISHCSWCQKTYLFGRIPVSGRLFRRWDVAQGICVHCAERLVEEINRCHDHYEADVIWMPDQKMRTQPVRETLIEQEAVAAGR